MWLDVTNKALSTASGKTEIVVRAGHGKRTDGWLLPHDNLFAPLFLLRFDAEFRSLYEAALTGGRRSDSRILPEREAVYGEDVCGGQEPEYD